MYSYSVCIIRNDWLRLRLEYFKFAAVVAGSVLEDEEAVVAIDVVTIDVDDEAL